MKQLSIYPCVAVSCGYDTWFAVRLVMDYTTSHFTWSILGYLLDSNRSSLHEPDTQVSLQHGPLSRVHFGESLVVRLYSEIDQIHLSSEAQCVSHHLPPVDCHISAVLQMPAQTVDGLGALSGGRVLFRLNTGVLTKTMEVLHITEHN